MRLARRALVLALAMLALCAAASAQTLRQENDPRNTAPTVGTGGSPGGPTGLFTIYDGQTLRRGEFTFSIAYSNYDRDPGNVDITEVPLSFQLGLSDHAEIFYNTDGYRGVKVNNPQNLSSFYLPNSQLFLGGKLTSGPAIILAPSGPNVGNIAGRVIFRPIGNQPFVQFPFVGGSAGNFGLGPGHIGSLFGFPGFNAALGPPVGGRGNFGAASNFPGIGSIYGSILPGIVLSTADLPCTILTGNCRPPQFPNPLNPITVPVLFTVQPTYIADAPFINRLYGESNFSTHVFGGNVRLTGPNNPLSLNIIPMYRWYWDKADDFDGFNQLQRGASPGGSIGDFGLFGVVGGRLSRSVHMAVNFGYFLNSNPKSEALGDAVLLNRPDEFITGMGFDFPVNKHFQPIAEMKSVWYVGGRTRNALPNNPIDVLAGVRIFPRRWFGFSAWYRAHMNQHGERLLGDDFNPPTTTVGVTQLTGINVPGRGLVSVSPTTAGPLGGFEQSDDPHGFGFQIFAGHRNARQPAILPNQPPVVTLSASTTRVVLPAECAADQIPDPNCTPTVGAGTTVQLSANATDPDGDTLLYTYSTTGGVVRGDGPNATLDLSGVAPGTYNVTVEVDDGCGCISYSSVSVTVERCPCIPAPRPCPTVRVSCPDTVAANQPITFTADVSGGDASVTPTFNWSVSAGTISSGQGTSSITVDTSGVTPGTTVTATVDVGGYPSNCSTSASCTTSIPPAPPISRKIDEYGNIRFNDEKARLDNFAIALQNDPTSQGYLVCYGGRRGRAGEAQARCDRAKNYLVNERQIDAGRIVTVDGGFREELTVELWLVPAGAQAPAASPTVDPSEVQTITPRRRRGRRR